MTATTTSQPRAFTGRRAALQALTEAAYLEAQAHGSPSAAQEKEKAPTDRQEPFIKFKLPGYHFGPARKGRR